MFGTSFYEVLHEVLGRGNYPTWQVLVASFDWDYPNSENVRSPTSGKVKRLVEESERGSFLNLFDHYDRVVFHKEWTPLKPSAV